MRNSFKFGVALALVAGLAACGDDEKPASNNTSKNNSTNNNTTSTNNSTNNNTTTTNNGTNNQTVVVIPDPPKCGDADEPARCTVSPEAYTWGTASLISSFAVASDEDACCFDFTGEGDNDNALGAVLALVGLDSVNGSIADSIASGSLALALEHDGLDNLDAGDFTVNFWLSKWDGITAIDPAGNNTVLIDPVSLDGGVQPKAYVPNGVLAANKIVAGPGKIVINIELFGSSLALAISGAQLTANVDPAKSALDTGVALTSGKIGGYVKVTDIIDAVNVFASTCTCAAFTEELVTYDPATTTAVCNGDLDAAKVACDTAGEDSCSSIISNCGLLTQGLPLFTDIDSDGDGTPDALSLGATFTAAGAKINGIAAAE